MSILALLLAPTLLLLPTYPAVPEVRPSQQVRIEQRVIIRIGPSSGTARPASLAEGSTSAPFRIVERPLQGCIPVAAIAGVAAERGDRLRLYMRNRQLLTLRFDKSCQTEAFYSGFYVEQNGDGMLCPARDVLHSRSGVRCSVGRINRLVAEPIQ